MPSAQGRLAIGLLGTLLALFFSTVAGAADLPACGALSRRISELVREADGAESRGDHSRAAGLLAEAYLYEPTPMLLYSHGQARRKAGQTAEAYALLSRYLLLAPESPRVEEVKEHLLLLRRSLAAVPSADSLVSWYGEAGTQSYKQSRYVQARAEFALAYSLSPKPLLLFNVGQALRKAGVYPEALCAYERHLAEDPDSSLRQEVLRYRKEIESSRKPVDSGLEPAPQGLVVAPAGRRPLTIAKWVLLPVALVGIATGATLLALDGRQDCDKAGIGHCAREFDGISLGLPLLALGGASGIASVVLFVVDSKQDRRGQNASSLMTFRF